MPPIVVRVCTLHAVGDLSREEYKIQHKQSIADIYSPAVIWVTPFEWNRGWIDITVANDLDVVHLSHEGEA